MAGFGNSCGACKFLRRKCTSECVFAPYFSYDQAATHFSAVHKVFGASNVSKLLLRLPLHSRSQAAVTISYEALARMRDPVHGCVAHIYALQQQVVNLQEEIELLANQMVADYVLGITSSGCSQESNNIPQETELFSQLDAINMPFYTTQQVSDQIFDEQVNLEPPPMLELSNQDLFCDSNGPSSLERVLQETDQDVFLGYHGDDDSVTRTVKQCDYESFGFIEPTINGFESKLSWLQY